MLFGVVTTKTSTNGIANPFEYNKPIGKIRFKVGRTFDGIKRRFSGGVIEYREIEKMQTQNLLAIGYNVYRSFGIIASTVKIERKNHKKVYV